MSAIMPIAPAPMDVRLTRTPTAIPVTTVSQAVWRMVVSGTERDMKARIQRRKKMEVAIRMSATPSSAE
jgi:hypothetical protein